MDGQIQRGTRVINNSRDSDTGVDKDAQTRRLLGIFVGHLCRVESSSGDFAHASAQAVCSRAQTALASRFGFLKKRRFRALK